MRTTSGPVLALTVLLTASGCASILDGGTQVVTFNSEPKRAKVFLNGVQIGVTPLSTQVKRSKDTIVVVKKEGYEEEHLTLQTKLNTYFWGNILCGGFLGSTTDYGTGAMVEYAPNTYYISLEPVKKSDAARKRLSEERRMRHFILVNYPNLVSDLARGEGEYLASLYVLLDVTTPQSGDTLRSLRHLTAHHADIPAFAEAVLTEFERDPAP